MFEPKQSDLFYNDKTDEFFVCIVSAVTAARCEGSTETLSGSVPIVYKIDKESNFKTRVFPENLASFVSDNTSDLFAVTPSCPTGTDFESISKPFINYNDYTNKYTVTFLGRYGSLSADGISVTNFTLQNIDSKFTLLDTDVFLPKDKIRADSPYTFLSGYLNSDLEIGGNIVRNNSDSYFNSYERAVNYRVSPVHNEYNNTLGFNLTLSSSGGYSSNSSMVTGDINWPHQFSGGYITYNNEYTAFDPNYTIRVDFRARAFTTANPSAFSPTQSLTANNASRFLQNFPISGAGEGFCVYFHKAVPNKVIPNGTGHTLGYSPAQYHSTEKEGPIIPVSGLVECTLPLSTQQINILNQAESYLGVGFDIRGKFLSTDDEKPGPKNDTLPNNPFTTSGLASSISIRGNTYHKYAPLTAIALDDTSGKNVPLHTTNTNISGANAPFVDYRIDLSNKGNLVTVYNKLTSDTDYNTILQFKLNTVPDYKRWVDTDNLGNIDAMFNSDPYLLNVGLSFTTSEYASRFEIKSFEVTGVTVKNPFKTTNTTTYDLSDTEADKTSTINATQQGSTISNYIDPVSKSLRKFGATLDSLTEKNNKAEITLTTHVRGKLARTLYDKDVENINENDCLPGAEIAQKMVQITLKDIPLEEIDDKVNLVEQGELPENNISTITILPGTQEDIEGTLLPGEPGIDQLPPAPQATGNWSGWERYCKLQGSIHEFKQEGFDFIVNQGQPVPNDTFLWYNSYSENGSVKYTLWNQVGGVAELKGSRTGHNWYTWHEEEGTEAFKKQTNDELNKELKDFLSSQALQDSPTHTNWILPFAPTPYWLYIVDDNGNRRAEDAPPVKYCRVQETERGNDDFFVRSDDNDDLDGTQQNYDLGGTPISIELARDIGLSYASGSQPFSSVEFVRGKTFFMYNTTGEIYCVDGDYEEELRNMEGRGR